MNQQDVFQVTSFFPFDFFGLAKCLDVCFIDVLAPSLFATQTLTAHPASMYVDELGEVKVPEYTDEVLLRGHRYRHFIAIRLRLAIGIEDARERVLLLDEPVMAALLSLHRSLIQSSRLSHIVGEVLERQCRYHTLLASHHMKEIGNFTEQPTVWIHQTASSQPGLFIPVNPCLRSQPAPRSTMQMDTTESLTSTPLPQA